MNMKSPEGHLSGTITATTRRRLVWPDENLFEINLDDLVDLKVERDDAMAEHPDLYDVIPRIYQKTGWARTW
ncbi:MAG: hypothetical protein MZV63_13175 [Marinilabiliales bacterium]|nr:hypothetical protein [Marinilabiliales bacterium]